MFGGGSSPMILRMWFGISHVTSHRANRNSTAKRRTTSKTRSTKQKRLTDLVCETLQFVIVFVDDPRPTLSLPQPTTTVTERQNEVHSL